MTDVNDIAARFAAGLSGRRQAAAASQADRAAIADRAFKPIIARIQGLQQGLSSLGESADQIAHRVTGPDTRGGYSLAITFTQADDFKAMAVELPGDEGDQPKLSVIGLDSSVAAELARAAGAPYSSARVTVGPGGLDALCDAIEAQALNYFAKG